MQSFLVALKVIVFAFALVIIFSSIHFMHIRTLNTRVEEPVVHGPRKRYGLVSACVVPGSPKNGGTMYTLDVVQTSLLNKLEYCSQVDDTECHLSTQSSDICASFVWEKEFSLLRHLQKHEWLLWADCDAAMTNLTLSLDSVTQHAQPTEDIIVIRDHQFYNLGVLMIRNSAWSEWFLNEMLGLRDYMEHMKGAWRDQKALIILLNKYPDIRSHIRVVERHVLNSYAVFWRPGDLIYHQVNCKPHPGNLKDGYFPKCRDSFTDHAQLARELAINTSIISREFPSADALGDLVKPSAVRKTLVEGIWCFMRRQAVRHLNNSKPYR